MRSKAALLSVLLVLGCGSKNGADNISADNGSKLASAKAESGVPVQANTAALRWIGFPFDKPVYYRMEGFQGRTFEGGREYKITPKGETVVIDVTWTGDIGTALGQTEQWVAEVAGIRSTKIQSSDIKPPPIYLPAEPKKGLSWNTSYGFASPGGQGNISVKSTSTISGTEQIRVPYGTFNALVLKESGTMSTPAATATMEGKTWFVDGLGMVKAVQNITNTPKGGQPSKMTITITAIPKPKE